MMFNDQITFLSQTSNFQCYEFIMNLKKTDLSSNQTNANSYKTDDVMRWDVKNNVYHITPNIFYKKSKISMKKYYDSLNFLLYKTCVSHYPKFYC